MHDSNVNFNYISSIFKSVCTYILQTCPCWFAYLLSLLCPQHLHRACHIVSAQKCSELHK